MDIGIAIDEEAQLITRTVRSADSYDSGGNAVLGSDTTTSIRATIQPVSGSMLRDLPEGVRSVVSDVLWSRTALQLDDVLAFDGEDHRVVHVWQRRKDGFTKAAVKRVIR